MNFSCVRAWRSFVAPAMLLVLSCRGETPTTQPVPAAPSPGAARVTEAWLSGFDTWRRCTRKPAERSAFEQVDCGSDNIPPDLVSIRPGECNRFMKTEMEAVRLLAYVPHCTDAAVERLAALAKAKAAAATMSNLAAAYYVRAQRKDQPSDLVRALAAADEAVVLEPGLKQARFNRALAEEALGFDTDAINSWDGLRRDAGPGWAAEAGEHREHMNREQAVSAAMRWPLNAERLPLAAKAGDRRAVEQLVAPYRAAAQRHVEEEILPQWAEAVAAGRMEEAEEHLRLAEMIAAALATLTDDPYLIESVQRIRASHGSPSFRKAHLVFREARREERTLNRERAGELYYEAELALAAGGSPLRFGAMVGRATTLAVRQKFGASLALLRKVKREAVRGHYPYLLARVHTGRGYVFTVQGRYLDALAEYGAAQSIFAGTQDDENLNNVYARKLGLFRKVGHADLTWREVFLARRSTVRMFEAQSRHLLLGESALSAVDLGQPAIGLRYQNAAVRLLEDDLAANRTETQVVQLRRNLGVALRARAWIRARMRDFDGARTDLDEAVRLIGTPLDPREEAISSGFQARIAEVHAQTVAATDRRQAIASLTEAIRLALTTHYRTLIASLHAQRAELYRLEGNRPAALRDLRTAVDALQEEERAMLTGQAPPEAEQLWSAYFSRFQEAYRALIALLVEDGAEAEAFRFAEKARAYEPLHRALQRGHVPAAFRKSVQDGNPLGLPEIEAALPANTFLVQFCVFDHHTDVWIVWNGGFERRTLAVGNERIAEWTSALQRLAAERDRDGFEAALAAPYQALFESTLARIHRQQRSTTPARLVIVPDRAMHGLPFAALRNGRRYLIEDHAVAIAPSATLYALSLAQDRQLSRSPAESVLLVADPDFNPALDVARGLHPLQTAHSEASRIAKIYAPVLDVQLLEDAGATVPAFLRLAPRSTILHLATHGIPNPDVPSRSFLLLAPTENDSGVLDAERLIEQLRLEKTRLVVLSACSSAGGTPVGPEGLAPLVRPMVVAGVPGIVGTLWNVSDNSATEELLVRFHQHYREGHDADDALRLAQLDMLEDPDLGRRSAAVWAPFQMIGYASSPFPVRARKARR